MQLADILARASLSDIGVLDKEVDIPVLTGVPQTQGDLMVRYTPRVKPAKRALPKAGAVVVRAENGSNTHTLHTWDGPESYWEERTSTSNSIQVGVLTVPDGGSAYLVHSEEHGANGIGPGTYTITRQREWANEWRTVAD